MSLNRTAAVLAAGIAAATLGLSQAPDNTKMNQGDGSKSAVTADQQKMNASDRQLTQKIRKSVMAEKSLSTYAHNVKIISQNGKVTLKGPVRSEEEKTLVASKAADAAGGAANVDNQLTIAPGK